jgi:cell pole-organizing protein PopZ
MDEILASIRRIIESNEPVLQAHASREMAEPEGFSAQPANDDSEEVSLTVDEAYFEREDDFGHSEPAAPALRSVEPATRSVASSISDFRPAPAAPVAAPQKSLSLADVAARVRAASERSTAVLRDSAANEQRPAEPAPAALRTQSVPLMLHSAPADERVEDTVHVMAEAPHDVTDGASDEPATLLSSRVGEQVARSFQDLALALDNAERRSIDEIAEDMLRPMLQEWLDDNLPTMVERLVREEIERVARGPRR